MKKIAKTIKKSYTKNEKSSEILNKKFEKIIWKTKNYQKIKEIWMCIFASNLPFKKYNRSDKRWVSLMPTKNICTSILFFSI